MLRRRDLKLATKVKVIRSDNIGPQRRLLVMDIQLDLGQHWQAWTTRTERIKWGKLKDQLRLNDVTLTSQWTPSGTMWSGKSSTRECALGNTKPRKRVIDKQIWWGTTKCKRWSRRRKRHSKRGTNPAANWTTNNTKRSHRRWSEQSHDDCDGEETTWKAQEAMARPFKGRCAARQHHPGGGSGPSQMETGVQNSGTCTYARYSLGQRSRSYIIVQFFILFMLWK